MKSVCAKILTVSLLLALAGFTLPAFAAEKSEDQLITDLSSPKESVVTSALQHLEKQYPTSTKALPAIKKLLGDSRDKVARKAARVLGSLHAQVSADDVAAICKLLKSSDTDTVIDGLKSLRGLNATSAVPEIVPLLKNPTVNIVRDACRTLAVLGDKSTIPSIEPLLKSSDPKIQKDAMDAIDALKRK
ncbi:MAG TPA: HEAT repeat domain-containing protein [Verrucomicrobiae bacterium]|nr:HEAT repeat domain-containing protein [Verrucomicrobiae bacterium]